MGLYSVSGISKLSVCGPVKLSFRAGNLPGSNPGDFNRLSVGLYGFPGLIRAVLRRSLPVTAIETTLLPGQRIRSLSRIFTTQLGKAFEQEKGAFSCITNTSDLNSY